MNLKDVQDKDIDSATDIVASVLKAVCGLARLINNINSKKDKKHE